MKKVVVPVIIAAVLWFVMFSPWTRDYVNFWITMGFAAVALAAMSAFLCDDFREQFSFSLKDVLIGMGSAVVLYFVFYLGDFFSSMLFDFARGQVDSIYRMKEGQSPLLLGLLLAFFIGPAEEIFWRGFVQRKLAGKYGQWQALAAATLVYTLVHVWSFNFMLIMAALVCGAFWGLIYKYNRSLTTLIVSHALWDLLVFIVFPIV